MFLIDRIQFSSLFGIWIYNRLEVNIQKQNLKNHYLKKQAGRTALELNKLIQSSTFTAFSLNFIILLTVRQKRHHIQHQVPIPTQTTKTTNTQWLIQPLESQKQPKIQFKSEQSSHLKLMRREHVTKTFSLFLKTPGASVSFISILSFQPKSVRFGRSSVTLSSFFVGSIISVCFRFFSIA